MKYLSFCVFLTLFGCGSKKSTDDSTVAVSDCFTLNVSPIATQKCANCHVSHTSRWYDNKAAFLASRAKARVAAGDMPQPGSAQLTATKKATFANCN